MITSLTFSPPFILFFLFRHVSLSSLSLFPLTKRITSFFFCPSRPGVLKDLKKMGSISLFIFFITLLVLARQVSPHYSSLNDIIFLSCAAHSLTSQLSFALSSTITFAVWFLSRWFHWTHSVLLHTVLSSWFIFFHDYLSVCNSYFPRAMASVVSLYSLLQLTRSFQSEA